MSNKHKKTLKQTKISIEDYIKSNKITLSSTISSLKSKSSIGELYDINFVHNKFNTLLWLSPKITHF